MKYRIGMDAGGTKTAAAAFDSEGKLLARTSTGLGNPTVDFSEASQNILQAVLSLNEQLEGECELLVVGAAGIDTGDFRERMAEILAGTAQRIVLINDAELALTAAHKGGDGILVIAGTGAIAYAKKGETLYRVGGWGHLINDDGGGYTIGMGAIRAITDGFDMGLPDMPLKQAVFAACGLHELKDLIAFTYRVQKAEIAALTKIVAKLAEEGNSSCNFLLRQAGEQLARKVVLLTRRSKLQTPRIACVGSVIRKIPMVQKQFATRLTDQLGSFEIVDDFDPVCAVLYL